MEKDHLYNRFQRQSILPDFGVTAQQKLQEAKVLIIGVGGLGCPALQYLAAIGVGHLGIVDGDSISLSNLHRQILYGTKDIGRLKAEVAKEKIAMQNESILVTVYPQHLDQSNAFSIITEYDIVLDCTDNFKTRYIINDACVILRKPLVFGAAYQYEGQVAVFNSAPGAVHYRDLFPIPSKPGEVPNCEEAGIFNIVTGVIGNLQAGEAIKLITGIGQVLSGQLLTFNALHTSFYTVEISPAGPLNIPLDKDTFYDYDYDVFCGLKKHQHTEISAREFDELVGKGVQIIDIRNEDELPEVSELNAIKIPLPSLRENIAQLDPEKKIILFCHSGIRTQTALDMLEDEFHMTNVAHLKGGIIKWLDYKSTTK